MITYTEWCSSHTDVKPLIKRLKSSLPEQYIGFYLHQALQQFPIEYSKHYDWLGRSSLDIVFPTLNLAVEYDGIRYHGDKSGMDNSKSILCEQHGITLIRVREDKLQPLNNKSDIVFTYPITRDYSSIAQPINQILDLFYTTYGIKAVANVDLSRDKSSIVKYIQYKYYENTMAYNWPEIFDYWDESSFLTPYDQFCSDGASLICPRCHKKVDYYPRYFSHRKSLVPCECEYAEIEQILHTIKEAYKRDGTLISLDNSFESRRIYDRIQQDIKYYCQSKEELLMYAKLGFDISNKLYLLL